MCTNKSLTSRFSALWHRMRLLLLIMCDCIVSVTWGQEPGAGRYVPGVGRVLLPLMCSSNPVTSIRLDDRNLGDMHVSLCRAVCLLKSTLTACHDNLAIVSTSKISLPSGAYMHSIYMHTSIIRCALLKCHKQSDRNRQAFTRDVHGSSTWAVDASNHS